MKEQEASAQATPPYVEGDDSESGDEGGVSVVVGEIHTLLNEFCLGVSLIKGSLREVGSKHTQTASKSRESVSSLPKNIW